VYARGDLTINGYCTITTECSGVSEPNTLGPGDGDVGILRQITPNKAKFPCAYKLELISNESIRKSVALRS
jgi:hypothetical protein